MIINHNMGALNANRNMNINSNNANKSMEKLSSGMRINKAGDDAAGLAISEKMRGQIRGLDQASSNGQDGISMIQTAEGALGETHSILQRMRELAVQASNDTNVSVDRGEIQKEVDELAKEVTRIANNTEFNTQKLINGGIKDDGIKSAKFHVGANSNQDITLSINAMDANSLGISRDTYKSATGAATGSNVTAATFDGTYGVGVVDTAVVTVTYVAGTTTTATAGTLTGTKVPAATAGTAGNFKFSVDSGAVTTVAVAATNSLVTIVAKINAVAGTIASIDGDGKLKLTSTTTGTASSIKIDGGSKSELLTYLGLTSGQTDAGSANTATPGTLTLTSDKGQTQGISLAETAKNVNVTTGSFQGMKLTFASTAASVTGGGDSVTISATKVAASKAGFTSGILTTEATTEAGIDVSTQSNASTAISTIQSAIETVSAERSKLGAYQNRLEHTIANLGTSSENLTSAESRIRDVDMAKEMSTFSKNNILSQAAQAMLAQANQQPQQVLQLLR